VLRGEWFALLPSDDLVAQPEIWRLASIFQIRHVQARKRRWGSGRRLTPWHLSR
jgi:hypothetical protein